MLIGLIVVGLLVALIVVGKQLRFEPGDERFFSIGREAQRERAPAWFDDCPMWTPDGRQLAFSRRPNTLSARGLPEGRRAVYVLKATGTRARLVAAVNAVVLAWASDGRRLVIANGGRLYTLELRSKRRVRVLDLTQQRLGRDARVWFYPSPTLRHVVVSRERAQAMRRELWLVDTRTRSARRLGPKSDPLVYFSSWSGDGTVLAYTTFESGLIVETSEGKRIRRIPDAAGFLSADGSRLAYQDPSGVHVLDLSSGQREGVSVKASAALDAIAPDGTTIVVRTSDGVEIVDVAGSGSKTFEIDADTGCSTVSPDGTALAFRQSWGGSFSLDPPASSVYLARLSDGKFFRVESAPTR